MSVCNGYVFIPVCMRFVCVQIQAPPLVQCTYIGPTVPIHNVLLCFKSIYFSNPPPLLLPPCLQRQDSSVLHANRRCSQTAAERCSLIHLAAVSERMAKDYSAARADRHSVLICCTRGIFDEVTLGPLNHRLVNRQDLLTLISTSALKCILWSLMNSISV